jgi:hypothetical protein
VKKKPTTKAKANAKAKPARPRVEPRTAALAARFALDAVERRIFELLYDAERADDAVELTVRRLRSSAMTPTSECAAVA